MSIYTTPLQFGYFLALAMSILFWIRSARESRLSDFFLGLFMLQLALVIQDYTFGFSGINFLWDEMNGIYRNVDLLIWPTLYFYLLTQTNTSYTFTKKDLLHYLPWFTVFALHLAIFVQGKYVVQAFFESNVTRILDIILSIFTILFFVYYGYHIRKIYLQYKSWSLTQFSNTETISFNWFRNLLYSLAFGFGFQRIMLWLDNFYDWGFYQDWWWNLVIVAIIFFVGLEGYAQFQPAKILMEPDPLPDGKEAKKIDLELLESLNERMRTEQPYLNPELNLTELAKILRTNNSELSFLINSSFNKNFNDYINSLRINEFLVIREKEENKNYTIEALAYDSGFNSKSTFNRAFKKIVGKSPKEYLSEYDVKTT